MRHASGRHRFVLYAVLAVAASAAYATPTETSPPGMVCNSYQASPVQAVLICAPPPAVLAAKDFIAIAISLAAFTLSALSWLDARKKAQDARRQSIEDDFWLRKVLAPALIEPLLRDVHGIVAALPEDCGRAALPAGSYEAFLQEHQPKIQQLMSAAHSLVLLDQELRKMAIGHLEDIEDKIIDYCVSNGKGELRNSGGALVPKTATASFIRDELYQLLESIRQHQVTHV